MKGLKRILLVLVVLLLVAGLALVLLIDSIGRAAIEKGGSHALGVPTHVGSLDIGLLRGSTELSGLEVDNPEGFDAPHFVRLGKGEVQVALRSLAGEVVEVPRFALSDVSIHLQRRQGRTNYGVILENLKRFQPKGPKPEPEPEAGGKRFVVRQIEIRDVRVAFDLLPEGGELTRVKATIPRLTLENVGSFEDAASIAEIASQVIQALLQASLEAGGQVLSADMLADLDGALRELGARTLKLEGLQAELEGIGKTIDEKLGAEAGAAARQGMKELEKTLEGLLEPKKKDEKK